MLQCERWVWCYRCMCMHRLHLQATMEVAGTAVCLHVPNVHNLSKRQRSSCFDTGCAAAMPLHAHPGTNFLGRVCRWQLLKLKDRSLFGSFDTFCTEDNLWSPVCLKDQNVWCLKDQRF